MDIRWARTAIRYDMNSGVYVSHVFQSSTLRGAYTGVYANLRHATLTLNNVMKCNVTTPVTCDGYPDNPCGTIYGSMTEMWCCICTTPAHEPGFWNTDAAIRECNNCYNYANNVRTDTFAQPGYASGQWCQSSACLTAEIISQYAANDGLIPTTREAVSPCAMTKLALVIWPYADYHWYRQDANGLWTHKPGATAATNLDNSGNIILDPEVADRGYYTVFAGYFFSCSSSVQGQGHATIAGWGTWWGCPY